MVWNPVRGCSQVSAGCTNCYAMRMAHRFSGPGGPYEGLTRAGARGPVWTGKVRLVPEALGEPLRWRRPRKVFVNSMSDLFHEGMPFDFVDQVCAVMAACPRHTFQVLTKRPGRMARYFAERTPGDAYTTVLRPADLEPASAPSPPDQVRGRLRVLDAWEVRDGQRSNYLPRAWPLPNVWLGVSVEDQGAAGERIPHLIQTPAAVRFLSCEPLLGPIDLTRLDNGGGETFNALTAEVTTHRGLRLRASDVDPVGWVIAGGESGPGARPVHPNWARSLRDQCGAAGVPFFWKQWGDWLPLSQAEDDPPSGVPLAYVHRFGGLTPAISPYEPGCPCDHSPAEEVVIRVGKKAAGRRLDGRAWDEFPAAGKEVSP